MTTATADAAPQATGRTLTYVAAIVEAQTQLMRDDPGVFIAGEDVALYGGVFGTSRGMLNEFGPARIVATPISDSGIIGLATGAAATGLRPIVEIMFFDFLTLASDQLVNHAAKVSSVSGGEFRVPMVVLTMCGAGRNTGPQHGQSLEAWVARSAGCVVGFMTLVGNDLDQLCLLLQKRSTRHTASRSSTRAMEPATRKKSRMSATSGRQPRSIRDYPSLLGHDRNRDRARPRVRGATGSGVSIRSEGALIGSAPEVP